MRTRFRHPVAAIARTRSFIVRSGPGVVCETSPCALPLMSTNLEDAARFTLRDALSEALNMRELGMDALMQYAPEASP